MCVIRRALGLKTIKTRQGNETVLAICSSERVWLPAQGGVLVTRRAWTSVQRLGAWGCMAQTAKFRRGPTVTAPGSPPNAAQLLSVPSDLPISILK